MGSFFRVFSLRNLLVLSLALNVSLIWRVLYEKEDSEAINGPSLDNKREAFRTDSMASEAQATQRTHLYIPSSSSSSSTVDSNGRDRVINLDHGDPTMYERYWQQTGDKSTILIPGWQSMSYFSDAESLCWFLEPEFAKEIIRLHKMVGNAVTEDRYIVVGTGSTQLYQAVLYALPPQMQRSPLSYPLITDCLKSGLYKWAGDAQSFNKEGPYIELVTSPNNPDGHVRQSVVNKSGGILVHDLAYYWPQYSPIAAAADHDIMLFTVSKSTGHAGMRIGWALVKDEEVAKKMVKYVELNTIGVSKDSQLRAAKVLQVVTDGCKYPTSEEGSLFDFAANVMEERWKLLRAAVRQSGLFTLPEFSPGLCRFLNSSFAPRPAFAWLKCEAPIEDCEAFLRSNKILTRGGKHFGVGPQYVRISMLDRDENYDVFVQRLSTIHLRQSMQVDETVQ
ncbi:tryptophan aminotransferase-related protein [Salix suchowensis]|nr:tryptophan aminotransferase-related protein [Salix suchowensis]